jgi:hypothetical protein
MSEKFDLEKEIAKKVIDAEKTDIKVFAIGEPGRGMSHAAISESMEIVEILDKLRCKDMRTIITVQEPKTPDKI